MHRKIVVADDDPLNLDLMTDVLKSLRGQGVEVLAVDDGLQAFNLIHEVRPQVVVLDAEMPGMEGCEVCRQIKQNPDLAGTYVVMVTANVQESQRRIALDAGVDEYIVKPFDVFVLRERVMDVLGINSV
ncbi:MAG TPA: response regulator [Aggregatilineales bacterium]|nr:response regulator [Chloroflexota bacterium]HOA24670.1 response regulator [Aggregatilineales bacterium]HPV09037.1 response regulator [Aggregatilineales bacterium]HQA68818.1 response regulator [Aggregatilineales bacterium]